MFVSKGKPIRNKLILKQWANGMTYEELGKEYGISSKRIGQIVPKKIREEIRHMCLEYPYISRRVIYEHIMEEELDIPVDLMMRVGDFFTMRNSSGRPKIWDPVKLESNEPLRSAVYSIWNKKLFKKLYDKIGGYTTEEVI